jgi:hypothetical protein
MQQLMFEDAGVYAWREAPDPQITTPGQAGQDLSAVVDRVVAWDGAPAAWPAMTGKTVFVR